MNIARSVFGLTAVAVPHPAAAAAIAAATGSAGSP